MPSSNILCSFGFYYCINKKVGGIFDINTGENTNHSFSYLLLKGISAVYSRVDIS